jgi:hypothetical protein
MWAAFFAGIAQLVEQLICNQQVVGSNPTAGSSPESFRGCHARVKRRRSRYLAFTEKRSNATAWQALHFRFSGWRLFDLRAVSLMSRPFACAIESLQAIKLESRVYEMVKLELNESNNHEDTELHYSQRDPAARGLAIL